MKKYKNYAGQIIFFLSIINNCLYFIIFFVRCCFNYGSRQIVTALHSFTYTLIWCYWLGIYNCPCQVKEVLTCFYVEHVPQLCLTKLTAKYDATTIAY